MSFTLLVGGWCKWDGMRPKISLFRVIQGRGRRYCTRWLSTGGAGRSYCHDSVKASFRLEANSILTLQPLTDDLGREGKVRKRNKKLLSTSTIFSLVNFHYCISMHARILWQGPSRDNLDWVSDPCVKSRTAPPSVVVSASSSNRRCRRRGQYLCFTPSVPPPWAS